MKEVIGVRFRQGGKIYYFSPLNYKVDVGRNVIVETTRGIEFGKVVLGVREIDESKLPGGQLKPIIRIATKEDEAKNEENKEKSKKAYQIGLEKIHKHQLEMKLIGAEYTFDGNKVLFYFTADGRIDFRELVKDLASVFKTRIELRQVGVRDETKLRGGIGMCGRELCCHTHLADFAPVSSKISLSILPRYPAYVAG
jgi:cell fate regulator YaaT (PSP1 superfamily)